MFIAFYISKYIQLGYALVQILQKINDTDVAYSKENKSRIVNIFLVFIDLYRKKNHLFSQKNFFLCLKCFKIGKMVTSYFTFILRIKYNISTNTCISNSNEMKLRMHVYSEKTHSVDYILKNSIKNINNQIILSTKSFLVLEYSSEFLKKIKHLKNVVLKKINFQPNAQKIVFFLKLTSVYIHITLAVCLINFYKHLDKR